MFDRTDYLPAVRPGGSLADGLLVRWFDFAGSCCADIDEAPLKENFICDRIAIPEDVVGNIGLVFEGYVKVPEDGIYSFYTYSDDGSTLAIDGRTTVDNDGLHPRRERSGQVALRRGLHTFSLRYFDSNGGILEALRASGNPSPRTCSSIDVRRTRAWAGPRPAATAEKRVRHLTVSDSFFVG